MIFDPSVNIQIVLWGGPCEKDLTVGKTCIFKNFRYRFTNYGRYINSPKIFECNVEVSDDFKENVTEIKSLSTLIEDNLTFMAIQKWSKSIVCCKCSTKKEIIEAETFVKCTKCNTLNKVKVCRKALYARIMFKNSHGKFITLSLFHNSLMELLDKVGCDSDSLVNHITESLAKIDSVQVAYDSVQCVITEIYSVKLD